MGYEPKTPFGRTTELYHIARTLIEPQIPAHGVDKWQALAELSEARTEFGLSNRELGTLRGLLTFHPETMLCGSTSKPIVYPSNKVLSERLNGMPLSTLRRHLASLVRSGIIIRRDSPNGKRYVRRRDGDPVTFGFDLTPLAARFQEFCTISEKIRAIRLRLTKLRQELKLMRRDLAGLAVLGETERPGNNLWKTLADIASLVSRDLRRALSEPEMVSIRRKLRLALDQARSALEGTIHPLETSTRESQNERHHQNSNKELTEFEDEPKRNRQPQYVNKGDQPNYIKNNERDPSTPFRIVLNACSQIKVYTIDPIRHWHDLFNAAMKICPSIGINQNVWNDAVKVLGQKEAAIVVCAILERFNEIRSPGGYLRALTKKASDNAFSSGPMLLALLRRQSTVTLS